MDVATVTPVTVSVSYLMCCVTRPLLLGNDGQTGATGPRGPKGEPGQAAAAMMYIGMSKLRFALNCHTFFIYF